MPDPDIRSANGLFAEIKNELLLLLAVLGFMVIAVKIAYYKESVLVVIWVAASLFWMLVLPGYALTLHWRRKIGFIERTIIGAVAAMALTGITSYYLGLAGLKLQNQTALLPLAIIAVSSLAVRKSLARKNPQQPQEQKQQEQTT